MRKIKAGRGLQILRRIVGPVSNRLGRQFADKAWIINIACIRVRQGRLYLAAR
jgi:hypothetical protein